MSVMMNTRTAKPEIHIQQARIAVQLLFWKNSTFLPLFPPADFNRDRAQKETECSQTKVIGYIGESNDTALHGCKVLAHVQIVKIPPPPCITTAGQPMTIHKKNNMASVAKKAANWLLKKDEIAVPIARNAAATSVIAT